MAISKLIWLLDKDIGVDELGVSKKVAISDASTHKSKAGCDGLRFLAMLR
jgi:hypothetical protein